MRYKQEKDGIWTQPRMRGYKMRCCDCGLVHRMEFRVLRLVKREHGGFKIGKLARGHYIQLRASRDNRATAAIRKKAK